MSPPRATVAVPYRACVTCVGDSTLSLILHCDHCGEDLQLDLTERHQSAIGVLTLSAKLGATLELIVATQLSACLPELRDVSAFVTWIARHTTRHHEEMLQEASREAQP